MYDFFSPNPVNIPCSVDDIVTKLCRNDASLDIVDFGQRNLDCEQSRQIFLALQHSTHVKQLKFLGNCSTGAIKDLAASIKNHPSLEKIYLGTNQLNDEDIHVLCESLQENTSVKLLDVNSNTAITDMGAHRIAALLKESRSIERIEIVWTSIEDEGLDAICDALENNPGSSLVELTECPMSMITASDNLIGRFEKVFDAHKQALTAKSINI